MIGRYKLLEQIGEGGFGYVYMAEQLEPVKRRVALKIIKPGMDSKQVIGRFEAEQQALALMDHPNIAQVFDAGATDTGRPYFVMELVKGITITKFCAEQQLDLEAQLNLFIQVCSAVQHAHQKGIIHRDLKPSNILVTLHGGAPVPKVIDFGIAKATQQPLTDKTVFTQFQQFLGTPAYMSPEQATLSGLDVDTRSDIYSLGVLLYELVTGSPPFDTKQLLSAGLDEMRRIIREKEPERPSTRIRRTSASSSQPQLVTRHSPLPTDLDWIVMKCLEKDRKRRYETAYGLAMDLKRHLNNEPVLARPPSRLYEFQKTVRRHWVGFAATAVVILALAAGVLVSTLATIRAKRAERAQIRLREQAQADEQKAQTEAAKSQQVAQFLQDMLKGVEPSVAMGRDTTMLHEILDRTAQRIDTELTNQPEVQVELLNTLGWAYFELGQFGQAEKMDRSSLDLMTNLWGDDNPEVAATLHNLAQVLLRKNEYAEAEAAEQKALAINRRFFPAESPAVAASLTELAFILGMDSKFKEAESVYHQVLPMNRKLYGDESLQVGLCLNHFGMLLADEKNSPKRKGCIAKQWR